MASNDFNFRSLSNLIVKHAKETNKKIDDKIDELKVHMDERFDRVEGAIIYLAEQHTDEVVQEVKRKMAIG